MVHLLLGWGTLALGRSQRSDLSRGHLTPILRVPPTDSFTEHQCFQPVDSFTPASMLPHHTAIPADFSLRPHLTTVPWPSQLPLKSEQRKHHAQSTRLAGTVVLAGSTSKSLTHSPEPPPTTMFWKPTLKEATQQETTHVSPPNLGTVWVFQPEAVVQKPELQVLKEDIMPTVQILYPE